MHAPIHSGKMSEEFLLRDVIFVRWLLHPFHIINHLCFSITIELSTWNLWTSTCVQHFQWTAFEFNVIRKVSFLVLLSFLTLCHMRTEKFKPQLMVPWDSDVFKFNWSRHSTNKSILIQGHIAFVMLEFKVLRLSKSSTCVRSKILRSFHSFAWIIHILTDEKLKTWRKILYIYLQTNHVNKYLALFCPIEFSNTIRKVNKPINHFENTQLLLQLPSYCFCTIFVMWTQAFRSNRFDEKCRSGSPRSF